MSTPIVKGWCPGALKPMVSGDGLVVRIRPFCGRLSQQQASTIAKLARAHGNGQVSISNRANLQIRGVTDTSYPALIEGLKRLGLVDETEAQERQRNVMVAPFWQAGDDTDRISTEVTELLLAEDLVLPAKFGFAVDAGTIPVLQSAPADIRIEAARGGLLLVPQGRDLGKPVTASTAAAEAVALARWFASNRGEHTRMQRFLEDGHALPPGFDAPRDTVSFAPKPIIVENGVLIAFSFGQMSAETLEEVSTLGDIRLTPWRMILIEGLNSMPTQSDIISDPGDPLLRVIACTGAPGCTQAMGETREIAKRLAGLVPEGELLHVSGCAKNCAHPKPASLSVTASAGGYVLALNGETQTGLTADEIESKLNAP